MPITQLSVLIIAVFLFVCFLLASIFNYKARFKKSYHFRSHFPYELNYHGKFKDNIYGNLIYILYFIAIVVFFVFFKDVSFNGYLIFALVAGGLTLISLTALIYIPIDQLRLHMIDVAFSFVFSIGFSFAIVLSSFNKFKETSSIPSLVSLIISIVVTLIFVILILNPRLSRWAEMDVEKKEDGTLVNVRPKWFPLAYSEWAMMFLYLLSLTSFLVGTI
ncbi:MAG: hypothetical protein E7181_00225 [Erysipelotrichaceae bacterium]|nr:hypothetical protein [Erysipelotrichaceae bacterium]